MSQRLAVGGPVSMQSSFANRVMPTACNGRLASFRVPPLAASLLASDGTPFPTLLQSGFAFLYENPGFRKASAQGAKSRPHRYAKRCGRVFYAFGALTAHSARPGRTNLFHRFSELKDAGMLSESPLKSRVQNFSLYFCLDRPQYVVVLTDHSLDALSEMR